MKHDFDKYTTKEKCTHILLSCLDWGSHPENSSDTDIEERIREKLKFKYKFDPFRLRSCIDLIEDTEDAIRYFSKYGLQKYCKKTNSDIGEIYIKLYGVLNAIYLQLYSIIEIYEVCNIKDNDRNLDNLKELKIFELRKFVGAHTINTNVKSKNAPVDFKKNFYRITQCQLNAKGDKIHAVDGFDNLIEYNLYELVMDYNKLSEEILYDVCLKYMDSIFFNIKSEKTELLTHYELIPFKNFNYRWLYENERLQKRYLNYIGRELKAENENKNEKFKIKYKIEE